MRISGSKLGDNSRNRLGSKYPSVLQKNKVDAEGGEGGGESGNLTLLIEEERQNSKRVGGGGSRSGGSKMGSKAGSKSPKGSKGTSQRSGHPVLNNETDLKS